MRGAVGVALILAACFGIGAAASDPPEVAAAAVSVETVGAFERVDATLPDAIARYAIRKRGDGTRDVLILTGPPLEEREGPPGEDVEEAEVSPCDESGRHVPRALWSLSLAGSTPRLEPIIEELPAGTLLLGALDLDGDGTEEVLLGRPGELDSLAEGKTLPRPVLRDPEMHRVSVPSPERERPTVERPWFVVPSPGFARFYRAGAAEWEAAADVALPVFARRFAGAFVVMSPVPRFIGARGDGGWIFATSPEQVGPHRLRSIVVHADPATGATTRVETWARLPEAERLVRAFHDVLDGEPMLIALTVPYDKLTPFEGMKLRLFPMEQDRSRTGLDALFAVDSNCNLVQVDSVAGRLADADGDGIADLLLTFHQGFDEGGFALDAYLGTPEGGFRSSPKRTAAGVKTKKAGGIVRHHFGDDVTGDGAADLLLLTKDTLLIHAGDPGAKRGSKLVVSKATAAVPLPASPPSPQVVVVEISSSGSGMTPVGTTDDRLLVFDPTGDGRRVILIPRTGENGASLITAIRSQGDSL